ncbi:MAG: NFACT family protein, partial [Planctomycetota bacterium]
MESSENLISGLSKKIDRILWREKGKLKKLQEHLSGTFLAETYTLYGELIKINLGILRRGMRKVKIRNVYEKTEPELT